MVACLFHFLCPANVSLHFQVDQSQMYAKPKTYSTDNLVLNILVTMGFQQTFSLLLTGQEKNHVSQTIYVLDSLAWTSSIIGAGV